MQCGFGCTQVEESSKAIKSPVCQPEMLTHMSHIRLIRLEYSSTTFIASVKFVDK
jgi:hypothetical protein